MAAVHPRRLPLAAARREQRGGRLEGKPPRSLHCSLPDVYLITLADRPRLKTDLSYYAVGRLSLRTFGGRAPRTAGTAGVPSVAARVR